MLASHHSLTPVQQVVITDCHAGQRIDNFLSAYLRGVPKSRLYRIIRKGEVRVNKGRICVSYKLVLGDTVRIPPLRLVSQEEGEKPIVKPGKKLTEMLTNAVIYEDDKLIIINKPAGLAVHGGSGISLGLIEALRASRPLAPFLELVHRIDRDTSGCIMIAKKRSMLTYLHECLKAGEVCKKYLAMVKGRWQEGSFVDAPLLKYLLPSGERRVKVDEQGKLAQTSYKILEFLKEATLLEASPITGRTHQIRVHCAFMGHPIIGDEKYGHNTEKNKQKKGERLFLHAHELTLKLPHLSEILTVRAPMPMAYEKYCQHLRIEK